MMEGLKNILIELVNFIIKSIGFLINGLVGLLPESPFTVIENLEFEYLDTLNWVIPFSFMVTVLSYWIIGIGFYYLIAIPMRWAKVIQ